MLPRVRHLTETSCDAEQAIKKIRNCLAPSLSFRVTARLSPPIERKGPIGAGSEASERQAEAYILTGEKTAQLQRAENAFLLRIQMSHGVLGTGSASQMRLVGAVSGILSVL